MRYIRDDLKLLGETKYNVSLDFSKQVMHKINKEKRYNKLKTIASFGIVACIVVFSVVTVNKLGVINRIKQAVISEQEIVSTNDDSVYEKSVNSSENVFGTGNEVEENAQVINEETFEAPGSSETTFEENAINNSRQFTKERSVGDSTDGINEAIIFDLAESKVTSSSASKTYSKQMSKQDYLNEIFELVKKNGYKAELDSDSSKIIIQNNDFNAISKLVEIYIDSQIQISGDSIVITIE